MGSLCIIINHNIEYTRLRREAQRLVAVRKRGSACNPWLAASTKANALRVARDLNVAPPTSLDDAVSVLLQCCLLKARHCRHELKTATEGALRLP